jgi:thiamine-monophosphate kinase
MKPTKSERELVRRMERVFRSSKSRALTVGTGDDAALWKPRAGYQAVLTCDWFLEGSHFLRDKHPPDSVGWKCLARAVSDIAAMGGRPRCFLVSLAIPAGLTLRWFDAFLKGLRRASLVLRCELAGGDTTRHERVLVNVTVIGEVRRHHVLLRCGARAGDVLFVSGRLGEADAGLREVKKQTGMAKRRNASLGKHLYPQPRLRLGQWLGERQLATAAMDLSDGLSSDLPRLCTASGVGARIELKALPTRAAGPLGEAKQLALHGGDDYELLFTVKKKNVARIPRSLGGVKLTRIGEITREPRIVVRENDETRLLESGGWDPFR